ncbi:DUF5018 domain-containing protein [Alistipes sp.]|uniref:DUF5018 domain-containing protein n=1 Tax=Alistipes sp. TaxID=1872444 RepID=UPI0025B8ED29|nr:DUF5018 domain-containing protein [Alistipes sp.]
MKMHYLITILLVSGLAFTACEDPDDLVSTGSENMQTLTVKGHLVSEPKVEYDAVVNQADGLITVQVPYYISDTDPIQGDLTAMKVRASLPYGTRFEPGISGIHDLVAGIERTLVSAVDGTRRHFTIRAEYVKSDKASVSRVTLADMPNAVILIKEPERAGALGSITVYKTSSNIDGALKSAVIEISPWATIESAAMNQDGSFDLTTLPQIEVISQDGKVRTTYMTRVDTPAFVPTGKIGYITNLFGFQIMQDNPYGFVPVNNRSMAIIGDNLIIGNSGDASKMIVLNRFTGKLSDVKVNTTGITRSIHAITSDDAGHLIAVPYTNATSLPDFEIWVWKEGLGKAPTRIFSKSLPNDTYFEPLRKVNTWAAAYDIGRMVYAFGDVTSGNAMISTTCAQRLRAVFLPLTDGKPSTAQAIVDFPDGGFEAMFYTTKPIIFSMGKDNISPSYLYGTGNQHLKVTYVPENHGKAVVLDTPKSRFWTNDRTTGIDCIDFNGLRLIAMQNGGMSDNVRNCRMYVADITNPTPTSLTSGFIFDSREGDLSFGTAEIPGAGFSPTGMTSSAPFQPGTVVLGSNPNGSGDIVFGRSADGNSVQAYMLTTDQGLIAYEITRYDI